MLEKTDRRTRTACCMALADIREGDGPKTMARIRFALERCLEEGYLYWGICLNGKEFEYLCAEFLIRKKNTPGSIAQNRVKLILILPGRNYPSTISEEEQKRLDRVKENADKVVYATEDCKSSGAYAKCAELLLSQSSRLVTLCRGASSFAGRYLVKPAYEQEIGVVNCCQWDTRIIRRNASKPGTVDEKEGI